MPNVLLRQRGKGNLQHFVSKESNWFDLKLGEMFNFIVLFCVNK